MATNPLSPRELQILRDRIHSRHPELSKESSSGDFLTDAELDAATDAYLGITGSLRVKLGPDILQVHYQRLGLDYGIEDCSKMLSLFVEGVAPPQGGAQEAITSAPLALDEFVYALIKNSRAHKFADVARTLLNKMQIDVDAKVSTSVTQEAEHALVDVIVGPTGMSSRVGDGHAELLLPAIRSAIAHDGK